MEIFRLDWEVFKALGYSLSLIEAIGILSGLLSVFLATRRNILTWPTGIVNEIAFFAIFFQVQLYADMFLQVFFFVVTVYGWLNWRQNRDTLSVQRLETLKMGGVVFLIVVGTILLGMLMSHLHILSPLFFEKRAAYPYQDAFTTTSSILATYLLAKQYIETWYLWIIVDCVSIYLYYSRGIVFLSALYFVFLILASHGLLSWRTRYASRLGAG